MELKRGTVLGNNELLARIGRGGMASVWVARTLPAQGETQRLVAVKAMLPDLARNMKFRAMFLEEGQTVRSIQHENVVKVYDVGETDGILFMSMEWIEGDSLHAVIAEANKRKPIPPELAARVIAGTAAGLHAAHEVRGWDGKLKNLTHCDVSPHNIIVGLDGIVRLVDFGVASAIEQLSFIEPGTVRGKYSYMSPEQTRGERPDRRSDVFSLGIVLFELTTGRHLFKGRDKHHSIELVRHARVPRPSEIMADYPPGLEAVVMKALERDKAERFQSADEFRLALDQYLVAERVVVPPSGISGLLRRVLRERIEARRDAIRVAILELAGRTEQVLVPADPISLRGDDATDLSLTGSPSQSSFSAVGVAEFSEASKKPEPARPTPSQNRVWWPLAAATILSISLAAFFVGRFSASPADSAATVQETFDSPEPLLARTTANQPSNEAPSQAIAEEIPRDTHEEPVAAAISLDSLPVTEVGKPAAEPGTPSPAQRPMPAPAVPGNKPARN
jgi:serine/threonine-protein kinase